MKAELIKMQKDQLKMFRKELSKSQYSNLVGMVKYLNSCDIIMVGEELSHYVNDNYK